MKRFLAAAPLAALLALANAAAHDQVKRNKIPGSNFPIAESVEVTADTGLVFVSGAVPSPIVEDGDPEAIATYGDTEAQTRSVLAAIEARLQRIGLGMGDVVMMRAYLVADPELGRMDFPGFMRGYVEHFGTEAQPNLPARSAIEIAGLARNGWLVEIEVVAARQ
ncbi:MAG: RidA family protein [Pseudomonadota bacterium]